MLEKPMLPIAGWRQLAADFGGTYAANGLVAFIFAASGPVAIILAVGAQGGLSESDLASWIFGSFFVNGLISIAFCLIYREQLVFFWTIPGAVLVGPALGARAKHGRQGSPHSHPPLHAYRRCHGDDDEPRPVRRRVA